MASSFRRIPGVGMVEVTRSRRPSGAGSASWRNVREGVCAPAAKKARRIEAEVPCEGAKAKRDASTARKREEAAELKAKRLEETQARRASRLACEGKGRESRASCKSARASRKTQTESRKRIAEELKRSRAQARIDRAEQLATCAGKKARRIKADEPCTDARAELRKEAARQRAEKEIRSRKRSPAQLKVGTRGLEKFREGVDAEAYAVEGLHGPEAAAWFRSTAAAWFRASRNTGHRTKPYELFSEAWEAGEGRDAFEAWRKKRGVRRSESEQERLDREQREHWQAQEQQSARDWFEAETVAPLVDEARAARLEALDEARDAMAAKRAGRAGGAAAGHWEPLRHVREQDEARAEYGRKLAEDAKRKIVLAQQANLSSVKWLEGRQERQSARHERLVAAFARAVDAWIRQEKIAEAIPSRFKKKRAAAAALHARLAAKKDKLRAQMEASSAAKSNRYGRQKRAVGVYVSGAGWQNRPTSPRTGRPMTDMEMALERGENPLTARRAAP